jgi:phosphate transport system substrate-binding protein
MLAGLLLLGSPAAHAATHKDVTVTGAGSTLVLNIVEQWKSDFNKATGVNISYTGVGSGAGRAQLIAGTVDFAGSDVAASATEAQQLKSKYGDFIYVPDTAGAISVFYNVPGLTGLKLTAPTLAKIFGGKITSWNDPAIAADNGAPGPNLPIQVFVRSDKSGTSGVFTDYLNHVDSADWPAASNQQFPTDKGQIGKTGTDGVANAVKAASGGIGYGEHSFATERGLGEVLVKNGAGEFTGPQTAAVTKAIEAAAPNPDGTLTLNYTANVPGVYPISTTSYFLVPTRLDQAKSDNLVAFLNYAFSAAGQGKAPGLGYAPLPDSVLKTALAAVGRIGGTTAQAAPPPAPAPAPAAAAAPTPTTAAKAAPAPTPKAAASASPTTAAAPDPALVSTGSSSALIAALAGFLLAVGGLCVGLGRRRRPAFDSAP